MIRRVHALFLPLRFPSGVAPGEGGDYNVLTVARNGDDKPVLRGTAVAGALRHAWAKHLRDQGKSEAEVKRQTRRFFGWALESRSDDDERATEAQPAKRGIDSLLQVGDTVLNQMQQDQDVVTRTHHWRNRHTGVVTVGGLYSLEACPPGSTATVALWLREPMPAIDEAGSATPDDAISADEFLDVLVASLEGGLTLGGNAARGIGAVELDRKSVKYKTYDLSDIEQHASFLDDHLAWRQNSESLPAAESLPEIEREAVSPTTLQIDFCLKIPRGQDLLVGDGQGRDHEMEPQRVTRVDGTECWRIPGGTLRGIFRGWSTRLAARNRPPGGGQIADDAETYRDLPADKKSKPRHIEPADEKTYLDCPVNQLFGSVFAAGRIHISDAEAPCLAKVKVFENGKPGSREVRPEEQVRMHVAVDRVTGGAAESMLFDNTVLTGGPDGKSPEFNFSMRVDKPKKHEVEWLVATLHAIDLGILRVGSSKSSGRLCLKRAPVVRGEEKFVEMFQGLLTAEQLQRG